MGVDFLRPRVCDLVFQLYARPLHPEFFDVLKFERIRRGDYELFIRITRTGHVISWSSGNLHLTELAACDHQLPEASRLLHHRLRGEQSHSVRCAHGVRYQTNFQVETLPREIFLHVHDEIIADGGKRGLLHHFEPHNRLSLAPLGFVSFESRADCLFLSSFHTFPDEHAVIKTQSLIETTPRC